MKSVLAGRGEGSFPQMFAEKERCRRPSGSHVAEQRDLITQPVHQRPCGFQHGAKHPRVYSLEAAARLHVSEESLQRRFVSQLK